MAKGIIFTMTTSVPGLIMIGKASLDKYESEIGKIEKDGYLNLSGLKRNLSICVENYEEKKMAIDRVFAKQRLGETDFFTIDAEAMSNLLSSFEKAPSVTFASPKGTLRIRHSKKARTLPDGIYYLNKLARRWNNRIVSGKLRVNGNALIVMAGSVVCPVDGKGLNNGLKKRRKNLKTRNDILLEDIEVDSLSTGAAILMGNAMNGWTEWVTEDGDSVHKFRAQNQKDVF